MTELSRALSEKRKQIGKRKNDFGLGLESLNQLLFHWSREMQRSGESFEYHRQDKQFTIDTEGWRVILSPDKEKGELLVSSVDKNDVVIQNGTAKVAEFDGNEIMKWDFDHGDLSKPKRFESTTEFAIFLVVETMEFDLFLPDPEIVAARKLRIATSN